MTRAEIFQAFNEIFQDVFDDDQITVHEKTTAADIPEWDSLEHINLIVAIEKRFQMRFSMAEVTGLQNVGEMVDVIQKRLAAQ